MVDPLQPAIIDEALDLRALEALLNGDLDRAVETLATTRRGYRVACLCRLAVLVPSVALRLAWRQAARGSISAVRAVQRPVDDR